MITTDLHQVQLALQAQLQPRYGDREAGLIAWMCLEKITGSIPSQLRSEKNRTLTPPQLQQLELWKFDLLRGRPVQYVLEEAWFQDMPLYVNESVLIPRPETEELVAWIINDLKADVSGGIIVDIGTGSGCIPISLARRLNRFSCYGVDVSTAALSVAARNGADFAPGVNWLQVNFLDAAARKLLPAAKVIVSNPPYIPLSGKPLMDPHVTEHEPSLALFVPDEDPLLFYKEIALYAQQSAAVELVYLEIHEGSGEAVKGCFASAGFKHITVRTDMQGKDRMVKASR
ncbi:peptide chain release factor N(5)-glutamine methyltransferase [Flavihumibacter petaseus]|uniref:peptide chain release factor N(5)-glutamine methyltransferase n=1 Tax=Flavihumibacter petaseus TaxID=549295 RepID=UPI0006997636|nr:peptide chain release factor N(5)-glutamine methyltransferase [Flavihumibacter petaseus]